MHKWDAQDYQKNSGAQLKWGRELIGKLDLKAGEHVLDLGCGDGKITAEIANIVRSGKATGIDSSADMISLACRTFPSASYPNLDFMQMDMRKLTFSPEYDAVFSNAALHWVPDHLSVLNGVARCLKKGGRILLQMGGRGNVADIMAVVIELIKQPEWSGYFKGFATPYSFYGTEEYRKWLPQAGLNPRRIELIPKDMAQEGKDGLASWFRTTWHPYIHCVPDGLQQAFTDEAINTYTAAHPADSNGIVHLDAVRLEVEAVKI